jgi:hypothetical protein
MWSLFVRLVLTVGHFKFLRAIRGMAKRDLNIFNIIVCFVMIMYLLSMLFWVFTLDIRRRYSPQIRFLNFLFKN